MATSIITATARKQMAQARAGAITLPTIVGFVFGDGGVDSSGNVLDVDESATALNNEIGRYPYDKYEFVTDTTCRYTYTMGGDVLAGSKLSEIGLYDSEGNVVNIKHFSEKGKDSDLELEFQIDDVF